ncbi:MAG: bifunctional phosphoribosylaminoimidazolecarboxamide formyltransferase/IMP cyclohydrolase [Candidatus Norongarragalinales archaeon]
MVKARKNVKKVGKTAKTVKTKYLKKTVGNENAVKGKAKELEKTATATQAVAGAAVAKPVKPVKTSYKGPKHALISVFDKTGAVVFARALRDAGFEIMSTGGTAELLKKNGIAVREISDYARSPEIFGGRVKTLHPRVFGGILFKRGDAVHEKERKRERIEPIDVVAVNFYPFEETLASGAPASEVIEKIDVGGVALARAAAKNYKHVCVVVDPRDYERVAAEIKASGGSVSDKTRAELAARAFARTAAYDYAIKEFFEGEAGLKKRGADFPEEIVLRLEREGELRYGENPHQKAAAYKFFGANKPGLFDAPLLQGKKMSFNNYLDANAAIALIREFRLEPPTAVIVKHNNACGGATAKTLSQAFEQALACDPISAFGGVFAFNRPIDLKTAKACVRQFAEIVIAPKIDERALNVFKQKPNLRVLDCARLMEVKPDREYRSVAGGMLVQEPDEELAGDWRVVTKRKPTAREEKALEFALRFVKHERSNAIVIASEKQLVGVGAGQTSRVDAVRVAVEKARRAQLKTKGCVLASDAFFPFRDCVDEAARAGITAIIQPGGSIRDEESIAAANERRIAMVFTGTRHFKH